MRWISSAILLASLAFPVTCALAQSTPPAVPPKPHDPTADERFAKAEASAYAALPAHTPATGSAAHFTVLLDAAHGGKDSGAVLSNPSGKVYSAPLLEKDTTLQLAQRLRAALADRGVAVRLTRSDDASVADSERAVQGSNLGGGVCVTLHATATGTGVHVFYPMPQFGLLNHSFLDQWTAANVTPSTQSQPLARSLQAALAKSQIPATAEPATGPVISREHCAAIAVELAPLRGESASAVTAADAPYQQRVATAVAQAIADWRDQRRSLDAGAAAYARKSSR